MNQEWEHLLPLVDALVSAGNEAVRGGFQPNQGGWDCEMRLPLDLDLLRPLIEADAQTERIKVGRDEVGCLHCWASIFGPNHVM